MSLHPIRAVGCVVLLGVVFCTSRAHAARWHLFVAPSASVPVGMMREAYGPSATIAGGIGYAGARTSLRFSLAYSPLRSVVDSLPGIVHHASAVGEVLVPGALGIGRLTMIGGVGFGARQLHEGRQIEKTVPLPGGFTRTVIRRVGFGEPVVDLVSRLGVALRLFEFGRWTVSCEVLYQASFALKNPPGISLDLRVDELIRAGLTFDVRRNPSFHR